MAQRLGHEAMLHNLKPPAPLLPPSPSPIPAVQFFDVEALDFQRRILNKSALSQETFFPPGLHGETGSDCPRHALVCRSGRLPLWLCACLFP